MLDAETQIGDLEGLGRSLIYEKIDNARRFELVRMLQQEEVTLREAAESLEINYSTAKTIVQTFRKEKRIAKKPKIYFPTKRSQKLEKSMKKCLTRTATMNIMENIFHSETKSSFANPSPKKRQKLESDDLQGESVLSTRDISHSNWDAEPKEGEAEIYAMHKNTSAGNFSILLEDEEEGLLRGDQQSVGLSTWDLKECVPQGKKVFSVVSDADDDMQFRDTIDFANPMHLKFRYLELKFGKSPLNPVGSRPQEELHMDMGMDMGMGMVDMDINPQSERSKTPSLSEGGSRGSGSSGSSGGSESSEGSPSIPGYISQCVPLPVPLPLSLTPLPTFAQTYIRCMDSHLKLQKIQSLANIITRERERKLAGGKRANPFHFHTYVDRIIAEQNANLDPVKRRYIVQEVGKGKRELVRLDAHVSMKEMLDRCFTYNFRSSNWKFPSHQQETWCLKA